MISKKFGIIGGDMRQYYLAKSLKDDGHDVKITGIEKLSLKNQSLTISSFTETINFAQNIILPVPMSRDKKFITAPFSEEKINIDSIWNLENKKIFGGIIPCNKKSTLKKSSEAYDFYRDDFMILNAIPTAEGAIKEVLNNIKKTIRSCKCLVTGYGRIGKVLCTLLKNMGVDVTAAMRSNTDFAYAEIHGIKTENISDFSMEYDVIFNTVPHIILNQKRLKQCQKDVLIIDLASEPGGIDKECTKSLKIKSIHALGLPGKYFPETAGKIIKTVIYKIIEEENL